MKKAQSSIEAAVLIAVMSVIVLGFVAVVTTSMVEIEKQNERVAIEEIADVVQYEIGLASSAQDGYSRIFTLPDKLSGHSYAVKLRVSNIARRWAIPPIPDDTKSELFIQYVEEVTQEGEDQTLIEEYETSRVLPFNITGTINENEGAGGFSREFIIIKDYGIIAITPVGYCDAGSCTTEFTKCAVAADAGACDDLDPAYSDACCADHFIYCCCDGDTICEPGQGERPDNCGSDCP
ncbi:MAG: hypothetical protein GY861_15755 [bacterium]|nr:hypothetical protein [bacterium]